jgi:hypothetical protein
MMIGQDTDLSFPDSAGGLARKGISAVATTEPDENKPDVIRRDAMKKASVRKLRFQPSEAAGLCVGYRRNPLTSREAGRAELAIPR